VRLTRARERPPPDLEPARRVAAAAVPISPPKIVCCDARALSDQDALFQVTDVFAYLITLRLLGG
jgi:hypothetical protein